MNNTEANRRLLDSLNVKYKVCEFRECNSLFLPKSNQIYCGEERCIELQLKINRSITNLREKIRARSRRVYPVQKCTVYVCQELGERHHEDYTDTKCIFLCHKHHSMLHSLKKQLKVYYLSKDILDKFLALGCEL